MRKHHEVAAQKRYRGGGFRPVCIGGAENVAYRGQSGKHTLDLRLTGL
jgi:hypothetical protein